MAYYIYSSLCTDASVCGRSADHNCHCREFWVYHLQLQQYLDMDSGLTAIRLAQLCLRGGDAALWIAYKDTVQGRRQAFANSTDCHRRGCIPAVALPTVQYAVGQDAPLWNG